MQDERDRPRWTGSPRVGLTWYKQEAAHQVSVAGTGGGCDRHRTAASTQRMGGRELVRKGIV